MLLLLLGESGEPGTDDDLGVVLGLCLVAVAILDREGGREN